MKEGFLTTTSQSEPVMVRHVCFTKGLCQAYGQGYDKGKLERSKLQSKLGLVSGNLQVLL